ncbi:MAG: type II secretion system protein [Chloroflexi bacterium]|nr:type II secretion system protein [Chloroflexota bacterium]
MKRQLQGLRSLECGQAGAALVEILVAVALLGLVAAAILTGLATAAKATITATERSNAESLARTQLEYVKKQAYSYNTGSYELDPALAADAALGWTVLPPDAAPVHASDDGIQKVTVTVQRYGKTITSVSAYKVDR